MCIKRIVIGGLAVIACGLGYTYWSACREVPAEPDRPPQPGPNVVIDQPIDTFRTGWSSEHEASWPVTGYLAEFSLRAYDDRQKLSDYAKSIGFDDVNEIVRDWGTVLRGTNVAYVAVAKTPKVMVIVFRGTDDLADFFADMDCLIPERTADGGVHRGFNRGYAAMRDEIRSLVTKHRPEHLWITGHSLGGALAAVCAADVLSIDAKYPQGVITFGQPMIALNAVANSHHRKLDGRYVHFANDGDLVTRVPPLPYRHFGSLALFDESVDGQGRVRRYWGVYQPAPDQSRPPGMPAMDDRNDIPPLPKEEAEALKQRVLATRAATQGQVPGVMYGSRPGIEFHSMEIYRDRVMRLVVKDPAWINPPKAGSLPPTGALPKP